MIYIRNKKTSEKTLEKLYPNALIVDVTSKAVNRMIELSPFYPHGDIPVPYSKGFFSKSVEGIWQGLKVFEKQDIDLKSFHNDKMKNIKRTVRKFGVPKGHRKGVKGTEIIKYIEARILIYLPSFLWVLENKVQEIMLDLKESSKKKDIILLDYTTNCDIFNTSTPLSHAYLIKTYAEDNYPSQNLLIRKLKDGTYKKTTTSKKDIKDIPLEKIIQLLKEKPMSSKEIVDTLNIEITPIKLTTFLKRTENIATLKMKPLKFKYQIDIQQKLF